VLGLGPAAQGYSRLKMGGRERVGIEPGGGARESPRTRQATPAFGQEGLLALQRTAGNAATGRMLNRLLARQTAQAAQDAEQDALTGPDNWTKDELKSIQRELRRLRLYSRLIDGIYGFGTRQGLIEAFGNNSWEVMTATDVLAALQVADRPTGGTGHSLRYGSLFDDGVLDVTIGIGYMEGNAEGMAAVSSEVATALTAAGFTADDSGAIDVLMNGAGRSAVADHVSTFFLKRAAFVHTPVAGSPIAVDVVVRIVANPTGQFGAEAAADFRSAMMFGDIAYYHGHARYGSGPDFDANFAGFDLLDAPHGTIVQQIDRYAELERTLRAEGDPWTVFKRRVEAQTLLVHFNNQGNVWLNDHNPHANDPSERFGSRLMYWSLEIDTAIGDVETGPDGDLKDAIAKEYRVLGFADVIETRRIIYLVGGAGASFMSLLNDVMAEASAEQILTDMNVQMRQGEYQGPDAHGVPFKWSGISDNPNM